MNTTPTTPIVHEGRCSYCKQQLGEALELFQAGWGMAAQTYHRGGCANIAQTMLEAEMLEEVWGYSSSFRSDHDIAFHLSLPLDLIINFELEYWETSTRRWLVSLIVHAVDVQYVEDLIAGAETPLRAVWFSDPPWLRADSDTRFGAIGLEMDLQCR